MEKIGRIQNHQVSAYLKGIFFPADFLAIKGSMAASLAVGHSINP